MDVIVEIVGVKTPTMVEIYDNSNDILIRISYQDITISPITFPLWLVSRYYYIYNNLSTMVGIKIFVRVIVNLQYSMCYDSYNNSTTTDDIKVSSLIFTSLVDVE